jgi:hypothetical protein
MLSHLRKPIDAARFVRRMSGTPLSTRDPAGFKSLEETYAGMTSNIKVAAVKFFGRRWCVANLFNGGCCGHAAIPVDVGRSYVL